MKEIKKKNLPGKLPKTGGWGRAKNLAAKST